MEVLQGNQSGVGQSRRRLDRLRLGENRALDWGSQASDIDLETTSALSLDSILIDTDGGLIDLLASDESPDESGQEIPAGKRGRLQTRHDAAELLRRCKKILVENALIKDKGDRQLYLAAGFISWPDPAQSNLRQRAPVLLYPALLVRIPDQQRYEIRLTGDGAEYNQALVDHAEQRFAATLPDFDPSQTLSRFFEQLTDSIRELPMLAFEQCMALGSASLVQDHGSDSSPTRLPDVPANFDVGLAMSITGNKSLHQLGSVLQLIPDYSPTSGAGTSREPASADDVSLPASTERPSTHVASLRKYAARLASEGLDHVEFRQLGALPDRIGKWNRIVERGLQGHTIQEVLQLPELSARELVRLGGIIELIDKAPTSIEQFAHGDLCHTNSTILLRRAQHQARLIEDEMSALQKHFALEKVPSKSQLLNLMSELGEGIEHDPELVDADYFNARRQFMEFSLDKPAHLTQEHRRQLSQLAKVLRFRELFVTNTEYRAALGPGYRGLRTDWEQLNQSSEYARELATVLGSETMASQILQHWKAFHASYSSELSELLAASDACRRLLGVVGTRWQSQSVSALLAHARLIATRLTDWRRSHGVVENHADKTPAMVLSSFSGHSLEDMVVENQVDETRSRIDTLLSNGEIRAEQISDTLQWLKIASQKASEHDMDIDAIVEHLQIT